MRRELVLALFLSLIVCDPASARPVLTGASSIGLFDANLAYTSGSFLPLSSYDVSSIRPLTTAAWTAAARPVHRVAADGVSLIVVRLRLPGMTTRAVTIDLVSDEPEADPGSLWRIDDGRLVDTSEAGGAIQTSANDAPPLSVPSVVVDGQRYAFALYRAPRNFDTATGSTAHLASRTARIVAHDSGSTLTETLTIVRPLVVFIHGTAADNDTWLPFALWRNSGNEVHGFTGGTLPFQATRISFNWIWNATGGVRDNAVSILTQLTVALRDWREATGAAATQADVVTHSFGGVVARQMIQTQPDPNPLSRRSLENFRTAANWGHGSVHKLITLAATHRGAATANTAAYINAQGSVRGLARETACGEGAYIDKGAIRDQMVLSDALKGLGESRVPGHAIAGAARATLDPSGNYLLSLTALIFADKSDGPYERASSANNSACPSDTLSNYVFNLDPNVPPVLGSGTKCSVVPNYDLVVSVDSALGLMPPTATTTASDLDLVGFLNHSAFHDPTYGSAAIVDKVSERVVFLLTQDTGSQHFASFPAVGSVPPTALEERFTKEFDPAWLEVGTRCPAPSYSATCPAYRALQVIPAQLHLEDSTRMPLTVYGLLDGEWVLAYSPTSKDSTSRNCRITLTTSDSSVATISTNEVTGAQSVVAAGAGATSITVTVQGAGKVSVPVTVADVHD